MNDPIQKTGGGILVQYNISVASQKRVSALNDMIAILDIKRVRQVFMYVNHDAQGEPIIRAFHLLSTVLPISSAYCNLDIVFGIPILGSQSVHFLQAQWLSRPST